MSDKEKTFEAILDSIADGVFTVDKNWRITYFNRAAEKITGVPREEALGKRCSDVFHVNICQTKCALRKAMETGREIISQKVDILNAKGEKVPISISASVLKNAQGRQTGGVETFRDLSAVVALRKELEGRYTFMDIVTKNRRLLNIMEQLPQIAQSDSSVLICGPSGSGKELFARAIHNLSVRKRRAMVVVNCGAIPETLIESELFGYVRGAFTGAQKDKPGKLDAADGSTLFLDEIGTLPQSAQAKLLRVLQDKTYEPLGSNKTKKSDVRIISATSADLLHMIKAGQFREDLYWRLNVIRIDLPPLNERKEDVPLLVEHFINKLKSRTGRSIESISPQALELLMNHEYSGNVRELENAIEHAFVLCGGDTIEVSHLPPSISSQKKFFEQDLSSSAEIAFSLAQLELNAITAALKRANGNLKDAARLLGIHPTTLWRKMKRYKLQSRKNANCNT
mgnify:CR=1 FL=1